MLLDTIGQDIDSLRRDDAGRIDERSTVVARAAMDAYYMRIAMVLRNPHLQLDLRDMLQVGYGTIALQFCVCPFSMPLHK